MSNPKSDKKSGSGLWKHPWGYKESFIIGIFLILTGFLIELLSGGGINMPGWPVNIAVIVVFAIYFIMVHYMVKHPIVKWLSSTQAAIASITLFTVMVLLLGFIPQGGSPDEKSLVSSLGLRHVKASWPYMMTALYLLVVLGFTIVRRFRKLTIKNIAFLLNHIGLWIVVVAASLGSADMWQLKMRLETNHPVTTAYDGQGQSYNMGFGMMLIDFSIEEFEPTVGLMKNADYRLQIEKGGKLATVKEGESSQLENYNLQFVKYIDNAKWYEDHYDTTSLPGGSHAVYIIAIEEMSGERAEGWVSDGSFKEPSRFLPLNPEFSIAMTQVMPKKYSSDIRVFKSMEEFEDYRVEVNKPITIDGWKVYQSGYDEKMGRWSETSIIELVRDPWLPVVYIGIFMILFGTCYLLWMGKGRTKTKKS